MDQDLDLTTKRTRDLLSSFYGDQAQQAEAGPGLVRRDTLLAINTKSFDAERYMSSLVHRTNLEGLLQKHVEMAAEIKNLDSDMQMLVYENYNKFISATDTIRRMKENISGMESNMEQLLEKVTVVRTKSDSINASLFERRERIEELSGTRSLLRKVQFLFDLPQRLRKLMKMEAFSDAVRLYKGALPVLQAYGKTSFQACREECEEVMASIAKRLQVRLLTESEPTYIRSEAVILLGELDHRIDSIMEKYLAACLARLHLVLGGMPCVAKNASETTSDHPSLKVLLETFNKDFLAELAHTAATFCAIFPSGQMQFTDASIALYKKYLENVEKTLQPDNGNPAASDLIAYLNILSTDASQMDEILPNTGLSAFALEAAEAAVKQHVNHMLKRLLDRIIDTLSVGKLPKTTAPVGEEKSLGIMLKNCQDVVLQGSLDVLRDLKKLLDDQVELMVKWQPLYVDLVQGGIQDLFVTLNKHFCAFCTLEENVPEKRTEKVTVSSGLVLLLARLSVYIDQTVIPKVTEEIAASFTGGGARSFGDRPPFIPAELCRLFRGTGENLLHYYINVHVKKVSMLIKKSVTTPNWLKYKEPREVRMFVDLLLQEVEMMIGEVKQVLEPGSVRTHRRSDSAGSASSSRSNPLREDRNSHTSISQRARSRLLERDVAKLFKQKIEVFTKMEYTQSSVISTVVKMCLKSFQEYVRLETFSRSGFQQLQVDTQFLRDPLCNFVDDEVIVNFLLDEVCSAAAERCLDPVPLEPAILEKLMQDKKAKKAESSRNL